MKGIIENIKELKEYLTNNSLSEDTEIRVCLNGAVYTKAYVSARKMWDEGKQKTLLVFDSVFNKEKENNGWNKRTDDMPESDGHTQYLIQFNDGEDKVCVVLDIRGFEKLVGYEIDYWKKIKLYGKE